MAGAGIRQIKDHLDACFIAADTSIYYKSCVMFIGLRICIAPADRYPEAPGWWPQAPTQGFDTAKA